MKCAFELIVIVVFLATTDTCWALPSFEAVYKVVQAALECSVYIAPNDPGLTYEEILEVGKRVELQAGEIEDAIAQATAQYFGVAP